MKIKKHGRSPQTQLDLVVELEKHIPSVLLAAPS